MTALTMPEELDFDIKSGHLHAQRFGSPSAPLVICIPGLSGNMKAFDFLGERVGGDDLQVVAVELRGRGQSDKTAEGTYGWESHARDVFDVAERLGSSRFTLVGQSMGGVVSMKAAEIDASRIDGIVLLDACGTPEPGTIAVVASSVSRLGAVRPSIDAYLEEVKSTGLIDPWTEYWERYYRYEIEEVADGVRSRTSAEAIAEDAAYGSTQDIYGLWKHLTMPVLLLRAAQEFMPGAGYIVSAADRDRFLQEVPRSSVVEVDANHITINTHDVSAEAIRKFISQDMAPTA